MQKCIQTKSYLEGHVIQQILNKVQHFMTQRKYADGINIRFPVLVRSSLLFNPGAAQLPFHMLAEKEMTKNHLITIHGTVVENK
jgi:hypothetical protein